MAVKSLEQRVHEVIVMDRDDQACFEGFDGVWSDAARRKAAAFRQIEREVKLQMLKAAGLLNSAGVHHKLNTSP